MAIRDLRSLLEEHFSMEFLAAMWPAIWPSPNTRWVDPPVFELEGESFLRYCEPDEECILGKYLGRSGDPAKEVQSYQRAVAELGEPPLIILQAPVRPYVLVHEVAHAHIVFYGGDEEKTEEFYAHLSEMLAFRWHNPEGGLEEYLAAAELGQGPEATALWRAVAGRDARDMPDYGERVRIAHMVADEQAQGPQE